MPNQTKAALRVPVSPEGRCWAQFAIAPRDNVCVYPTATDATAAAADQVTLFQLSAAVPQKGEVAVFISKLSIVAFYILIRTSQGNAGLPFV